MNVCTIIAKNYVAHARVLARSLADRNPGTRLWTLVIDDFSQHIDPANEPFEILGPADVGCEEFSFMAMRYSILELSTAVKPWLLRHLMDRLGGPVTYLDPDIQVFESLASLDELAATRGLVLTPHNRRPIPQDGRHPSQVDVMIAGVYNLGYVTVAPGDEVDALLDWWADRLRRDCRVDPMWGYFVDQRWFDLAPGFLSDLAILRDPGYNVAYWNLHERELSAEGDRYRVDGEPLRFFHFSGFDPAMPSVLSRHQDRVDAVASPALTELLARYAADVLREGHAQSRHWPYTFAALGDGTSFDDRLRAYLDEFVDAHGGAVASPFTVQGMAQFDTWLSGQEPGGPSGVTRALARVYEERPDLRGAFPEIDGRDLPALLEWSQGIGRDEDPILARGSSPSSCAGSPSPVATAALPDIDPPPAASALRGAPWGVNVVSAFDGGPATEIAYGLLAALDAAGVRAQPVSAGAPAPGTVGVGDAVFAVNLICLEPALSVEFAAAAGAELLAGRYCVGVWPWPVDRVPESWLSELEFFDTLWMPRRDAVESLAAQLPIPVRDLPVSVGHRSPELRTRAELGLPVDATLFYARCDLRAVVAAQNPLAVIETFRRAFPTDGSTALALDCAGADGDPGAYEKIAEAAAAHPDVLVSRERSEDERLSVLAASDCVVSLHRAIAFGPALAEGVALGKIAVATGYSGNLAYMDTADGGLVKCAEVAIGAGQEPLPADAHWAQPDLDDAVRALREVAEGRLGPPEASAARLRDGHAPAAVGRELAQRLETIRATGRARRPADPVVRLAQVAPTLAALPRRLAAGPPAAAPGRARESRERLRQAVLRIIRPYTAFQESINGSILGALTEVERELEHTRARALADRAEILAAMRLGGARFSGPGNDVEQIKRILLENTDRGLFLALDELARRHALIAAEPAGDVTPASLTAHELRVFSQNGEDGVVAEVLRRVGAPSRWFVEFGIESGREGNCVYLADVAGWNGLFMESDPAMFARVQGKYADVARIHALRAMVTPANVQELFVQAGVPAEPDVVSIDVDGQDYWIWEALQRFRPRVVIVEYNAALDPRARLVQPRQPDAAWHGGDYYGASLGALRDLGERMGYRFVHTELSAVNAFFVREDLVGDAFPDAAEAAVRGMPNFYGRGIEHAAAGVRGRYLDLDSGRLVAAPLRAGRQ